MIRNFIVTLIVQCSILTVTLSQLSIGFFNSPHTFEGYWYSPKYQYGLRISGFYGKSILSNNLHKDPSGKTILKISKVSSDGFTGSQVFADDSINPVSAMVLERNPQGSPSKILVASSIGGEVQSWELVSMSKGRLITACWTNPNCRGIDTALLTPVNPHNEIVDTPLRIASQLMAEMVYPSSDETSCSEGDPVGRSVLSKVTDGARIHVFREDMVTRPIAIAGTNYTGAYMNITTAILDSWVFGFLPLPSPSCQVTPSFSSFSPGHFVTSCCFQPSTANQTSTYATVFHYCKRCFPDAMFYAMRIVNC